MKSKNTNIAGKFAPVPTWKWLIALMLCTGVIAGCAQLRKATYPSDYVYLEKKEVTNEMVLMSLYLREIDQILLDDSTVSSEQQQRIIVILNKINASTNKLGGGNITTNHLVLDEHLGDFKSEVNLALRDASSDPPNYFALGRLSGGCLGCHKYRD